MNSPFAEILRQTKSSKEFLELTKEGQLALSLTAEWRTVLTKASLIKLVLDGFRALPAAESVLDEVRRQADVAPPLLFLEPTWQFMPLETAFHAAVYFCLELLCYESLEAAFPLQTESVLSRHAKGSDGKPLVITSIMSEVQVLLRKGLIRDSLAQVDPSISQLHKDFTALLALMARMPFDHDAPGKASILITELCHSILVLGPLFQAIFYSPVVTDDHYAQACQFILNARSKLRPAVYDLRNPAGCKGTLGQLDKAAQEITAFLDDWGLAASAEEDFKREETAPPANLGYRLLDIHALSGARSLSQFQSAFRRNRNFFGKDVVVEYEQPVSRTREWKALTQEVAPAITAISTQLNRIYSRQTQRRLEFGQRAGDLSAIDLFRLPADCQCFEDSRTQVIPAVAFFVILLVDNSCSINPQKQARLARILCLLTNVCLRHPNRFKHLCAYAQHSRGQGVVTLRRLIDQPTHTISDPSPVVHLQQSGVNYDAYALSEVVTTHGQNFRGPMPVRPERMLAIVLGDMWPVSQTGIEVKEETRGVLAQLRKAYPALIPVGIGVDSRYAPEELYDFYISVAAGDSLSSFISGFCRMIDQIVHGRKALP